MINLNLIQRAKSRVELGRQTGAHTGNPNNIYQIAEELLAELMHARSTLADDFAWRAHQCRTNPDAYDESAARVWDFARERVLTGTTQQAPAVPPVQDVATPYELRVARAIEPGWWKWFDQCGDLSIEADTRGWNRRVAEANRAIEVVEREGVPAEVLELLTEWLEHSAKAAETIPDALDPKAAQTLRNILARIGVIRKAVESKEVPASV